MGLLEGSIGWAIARSRARCRVACSARQVGLSSAMPCPAPADSAAWLASPDMPGQGSSGEACSPVSPTSRSPCKSRSFLPDQLDAGASVTNDIWGLSCRALCLMEVPDYLLYVCQKLRCLLTSDCGSCSPQMSNQLLQLLVSRQPRVRVDVAGGQHEKPPETPCGLAPSAYVTSRHARCTRSQLQQ